MFADWFPFPSLLCHLHALCPSVQRHVKFHCNLKTQLFSAQQHTVVEAESPELTLPLYLQRSVHSGTVCLSFLSSLFCPIQVTTPFQVTHTLETWRLKVPNSRFALHGLAPHKFMVCALFLPLIRGLCAFFRPLLTPVSAFFAILSVHNFWKATKEHLNQRGTKTEFFEGLFGPLSSHPFSPHFFSHLGSAQRAPFQRAPMEKQNSSKIPAKF